MPRVVTFLQLVSMSGSHTTYPSEQEEKAAKRQPTVSNMLTVCECTGQTIQLSVHSFISFRLKQNHICKKNVQIRIKQRKKT